VRLEGGLADLTRPTEPLVRLVVSDRAAECAAALAGRGVRAAVVDGTTLDLALEPASDHGVVWQAAQQAGASVLALEPVRHRFEDVFMQAISSDSAEASHAAS